MIRTWGLPSLSLCLLTWQPEEAGAAPECKFLPRAGHTEGSHPLEPRAYLGDAVPVISKVISHLFPVSPHHIRLQAGGESTTTRQAILSATAAGHVRAHSEHLSQDAASLLVPPVSPVHWWALPTVFCAPLPQTALEQGCRPGVPEGLPRSQLGETPRGIWHLASLCL